MRFQHCDMLKSGLLSFAVVRDLWVLEATAKTKHKGFSQLQVFKFMFACMLEFQLLLEALPGSGATKSVHFRVQLLHLSTISQG